MNRINLFFIYALLLVLPIHGASLQDATNLKKSFTSNVHRFVTCVKGDKDCSQGEIIASRIGLALVAAITGGTIIYLAKYRMPSQSAQETKISGSITPPLSPEQERLNHEFIYTHDINRLQLLLDKGADINAQDGVTTALSQAARYNSLERVQFLLDRDVNVNITSEFAGETPLMIAAYNGHESIVKALLTKNPMINMKDNDGHTALHNAAYKDNITIVQDLLKAGADPNIKNKGNDSPLDTAYNKPAIEALLKKYGAKLGKELP